MEPCGSGLRKDWGGEEVRTMVLPTLLRKGAVNSSVEMGQWSCRVSYVSESVLRRVYV